MTPFCFCLLEKKNVLGFHSRKIPQGFLFPKRNTNTFITTLLIRERRKNTIENNIRKRKMSATLIQSLLKDDKSKVATLIAAGASACALIYYNQEIRNQIANIFMVRLFYLLFLYFSLFLSFSLSLSLWFLAREEIHLFLDWTSSESNIIHLSNRCDERWREREREMRDGKKNARLRCWIFAAVITFLQSKQIPSSGFFFLFPARRLVYSSLSLTFSLFFF